MKPKVLVLLAVYNGEKWLAEQLTSIIAQKNIELDIIINIDKSMITHTQFAKGLSQTILKYFRMVKCLVGLVQTFII